MAIMVKLSFALFYDIPYYIVRAKSSVISEYFNISRLHLHHDMHGGK